MGYSNRELLARLIQCEAGGEGTDGMAAVASVVMNRVHVPFGEFARISDGGNVRNIIFQTRQFTCAMETINGQYNPQNIYNMSPDMIHYAVADWALEGGRFGGVGESLFFYNPFSSKCPGYFPPGGTGVFFARIGDHCFYIPTNKYAQT